MGVSVTWIWARLGRTGRWYYHETDTASWTGLEKSTAYRFATKEQARERLRRFARDWNYSPKQFVIIRLTRRATRVRSEAKS